MKRKSLSKPNKMTVEQLEVELEAQRTKTKELEFEIEVLERQVQEFRRYKNEHQKKHGITGCFSGFFE
jgi:hypothetical protein